MARFGRRLRELRMAAGLTQQELWLRTGVEVGHISKIETGRVNPTESTQERLLAAIDLEEAERRVAGHQAVIERERARRA